MIISQCFVFWKSFERERPHRDRNTSRWNNHERSDETISFCIYFALETIYRCLSIFATHVVRMYHAFHFLSRSVRLYYYIRREIRSPRGGNSIRGQNWIHADISFLPEKSASWAGVLHTGSIAIRKCFSLNRILILLDKTIRLCSAWDLVAPRVRWHWPVAHRCVIDLLSLYCILDPFYRFLLTAICNRSWKSLLSNVCSYSYLLNLNVSAEFSFFIICHPYGSILHYQLSSLLENC